MDLATAWKAFQRIVRDAQEAIHILHGYFRESTGRPIPGIVGSESMLNAWEQTRPQDRNDKKELLVLLTRLESSISDQNTSGILQGLRPILPPADKVESDIGRCLDCLQTVVQAFADDLIRDAADGDLCFRICPRYLRLREVLDPLTLLEDGYATSRKLEQATEPATVPTSRATGADDEPGARLDEICDELTPAQRRIVRFLWPRKHKTAWGTLAEQCGMSSDHEAVKKALERLEERLSKRRITDILLDVDGGRQRVSIAQISPDK